MCELFAVSAARKVNLNKYLDTFVSHSVNHPHGWGFAYLSGEDVRIEKEAMPAFESDRVKQLLRENIDETTFIGHIRLATIGRMTDENVHPFHMLDSMGRDWVVAHNGTIFKSSIIDGYKDVQKGSTDSERVALHIIRRVNEYINEASNDFSDEGLFKVIDDIVLEIVEHNKLNLMVYGGGQLFIHTNMEGTLFYKNIDDGIVFATCPVDDDKWIPLTMMQLFSYKDGALLYSGTKHNSLYIPPANY